MDREQLEALVARGLSLRAMAAELGVSYSTVRHWMRRYGLATPRARRLAASGQAHASGAAQAVLECPRHGATLHLRRGAGGVRCQACRSGAVSRRRRVVKATLVAEAGGGCALCGYSRYAGALQFHHIDPKTKSFAVTGAGIARSLARSRAEAAKCILLCANCHAEVEAGVATIAPAGPADILE
jgi:hypothetical protein